MRSSYAQRSLDVRGAILATVGLALLVYAIVGTDVHPWTSGRTIGLLAVSVVLLAVFVFTQTRVLDPLMPLSLFKSRSVTAANVVMLLLGVVFFSMWYFLSLYLQDVHGYSPIKTGLLFLPMSVAIIIGAQTSARLIGRLGPQRLLVIGLGMSAVGFGWLTQLTATSGYIDGVLGGTLLISAGLGAAFTPLATAATDRCALVTGRHRVRPAQHVPPGWWVDRTRGARDRRDRSHPPCARQPIAHSAVLNGAAGRAATTSGFVHAFACDAVIAAVAAGAALGIPRRAAPAPVPAPVSASSCSPSSPSPA